MQLFADGIDTVFPAVGSGVCCYVNGCQGVATHYQVIIGLISHRVSDAGRSSAPKGGAGSTPARLSIFLLASQCSPHGSYSILRLLLRPSQESGNSTRGKREPPYQIPQAMETDTDKCGKSFTHAVIIEKASIILGESHLPLPRHTLAALEPFLLIRRTS